MRRAGVALGHGAAGAIFVDFGVAISIAAVGLLQKLLFGLAARDGPTILGALALLSLVAIAAALMPARRAMRLDLAQALRYE